AALRRWRRQRVFTVGNRVRVGFGHWRGGGRDGRGGVCFGTAVYIGSNGRRADIGQRRDCHGVGIDRFGQRRDGVRIGGRFGGCGTVLVKQLIGAAEHILIA